MEGKPLFSAKTLKNTWLLFLFWKPVLLFHVFNEKSGTSETLRKSRRYLPPSPPVIEKALHFSTEITDRVTDLAGEPVFSPIPSSFKNV